MPRKASRLWVLRLRLATIANRLSLLPEAFCSSIVLNFGTQLVQHRGYIVSDFTQHKSC
jgi:hypothetical protein